MLTLCGVYSQEHEIFVVQQAMEAVGHTVDFICPRRKEGDWVATTVNGFGLGVLTWTRHKGHAVELTQDFDAVTPEGCDSIHVAGVRDPARHGAVRARMEQRVAPVAAVAVVCGAIRADRGGGQRWDGDAPGPRGMCC